MRDKTCKSCGQKFTPDRSLQVACSIQCAIDHANNLNLKRERKQYREAKAKQKRRQDWMQEAQAAFNRWVRLRDHAQPCISCGRYHKGQYHAGHYRTTKAAPELRFDPLNVHKQCSACNSHLSGNIVEYRKALIERIGVDKVAWLEGPHEVHKWTIDELKSIKQQYAKMARELEKSLDI